MAHVYKLSELISHIKKDSQSFFEMNLLTIDQKKPNQGGIRIGSFDELVYLSMFVIEIDTESHGMVPLLLRHTKTDGLVYFEIENVSYLQSVRNVVTRLTTIEELLVKNDFDCPIRILKYVSGFEEKIGQLEKSKTFSALDVQEGLLEKIPDDRILAEVENGKTCYVKVKSIYGVPHKGQIINHYSWMMVKLWLVEQENYFLYSATTSELYLVTIPYYQKKNLSTSWYIERE